MSFNIFVCVKQVPDSDKVKIDPITGSLIRKSAPGVLNGDDRIALESALRIKDAYDDVHIIAITMGPDQAREILLEAIGMGVDECIHINDSAVANSDTFATSRVLAAAIEKWSKTNEDYRLIITGKEATDGDTAQVGPQLAERLGIVQVTYVSDMTISDDLITINASRKLEGMHEHVEVSIPCLISVLKEHITPRYAYMRNIFGEKNITTWTADDLGLSPSEIGVEGSPSKIINSFALKKAKGGIFVHGENGEAQALNLLTMLKDKHII